MDIAINKERLEKIICDELITQGYKLQHPIDLTFPIKRLIEEIRKTYLKKIYENYFEYGF